MWLGNIPNFENEKVREIYWFIISHNLTISNQILQVPEIDNTHQGEKGTDNFEFKSVGESFA